MDKDNQLNIKVSDEEKEKLRRGAALNKENISSFMRRTSLKKADFMIKQEGEVLQ